MSVKTDAWVVEAGEKGAKPVPTQLIRDTFEFDDPAPNEARQLHSYRGALRSRLG